ncbi:Beta-glucosidase 13 [Vigna angularis]|uniref:Beta-glucosidase 13 n=1 Tax=Phaseolus angularis TaxID=3914 RepID=A0A8T0KD79_PHAAN|nr:Beta-glucosidase 13 [Vigna angularis]
MAIYSSLFLGLFALLLVRSSKVTCEETVSVSPTIDISINRNTFPQGFIFGAGSSSYQLRSRIEATETWPLTPTIITSMRSLVRTRLPKFTAEQARLLIGSFDFIGLNYYSTTYATDAPQLSNDNPSYLTDSLVTAAFERDGKPIGIKIASDWLYVYPRGIRDLVLYTKEKYNNPLIYITENGVNEYNEPSLSLEESLMDTFRIDYHYRHLYYLLSAIRNGANVKGYYVWSFFDNFEWTSGYTSRFGMIFIDYKNGLKRYPKLSATWYKNFLKKKTRLYSSSK